MSDLLFLVAGFVPLIFGANLLVNSASSLAKKLDIPNIVIGLTIVAFGTSSPELIVNIVASITADSDITLGNIMGSNIFNILVILGTSAIIFPLTVKTNTTWIEIPLCLLSAMVVLIMANGNVIDNVSVSVISRTDGILLLLFFMIFISYNIKLMRSGSFNEEVIVKQYSIKKSVILIVLGLILLVAGGRIIVLFAAKLAQDIGISERIIALTIVSIGTSLPELATSVVAARKRNVDIAIGNIVGSNIFNVFFILGISAAINPISVKKMANLDLITNIIASILLFLFIFTGKGRKLERWEGIIFLFVYVVYIIILLR
jgi:cation:H+ antiporter